jgi:O-antigen/teichoic acid export membrane protein
MAGTAVLAVLVAFYPETFTPAKSLVLGGAFNAIVMVINTIWQRRHAWSPTTVAKVAVQAAETGNAAAAVEAHK